MPRPKDGGQGWIRTTVGAFAPAGLQPAAFSRSATCPTCPAVLNLDCRGLREVLPPVQGADPPGLKGRQAGPLTAGATPAIFAAVPPQALLPKSVRSEGSCSPISSYKLCSRLRPHTGAGRDFHPRTSQMSAYYTTTSLCNCGECPRDTAWVPRTSSADYRRCHPRWYLNAAQREHPFHVLSGVGHH